MTKEEAVKLYDSKFWEKLSYREIAEFQLFEKRLCIPFDVFHKAVGKALGRPVWNHEFGTKEAVKGMQEELMGDKEAPNFTQIYKWLEDNIGTAIKQKESE